MEQENLIAGVSPGGFQDVYEVRILICYLLHSIAEPLSKEHLNEIFQSTNLVNYFVFSDALSQLLTEKQLSVFKIDADEYYRLNQSGIDTANLFRHHLPRSVRKKVVEIALKMLSKQKRDRENEVITEKLENGGYNITFVIHDIEFELMRFSLFVPDEVQVDVIKSQFLKSPTDFYTHVITYLTQTES